MGCDIHMFCEELITVDNTQLWFNRDHWMKNPDYLDKKEDDNLTKKYECVELHGFRDYRMFAALCGVRGRNRNQPMISMPRGLPEDACKEALEESELWDSDGHSHSYVTLQEVKDFIEQNSLAFKNGYMGNTYKDRIYRDWEQKNHPNPLLSLFKAMEKRFNPYKNKRMHSRYDEFRIVFWFDN